MPLAYLNIYRYFVDPLPLPPSLSPFPVSRGYSIVEKKMNKQGEGEVYIYIYISLSVGVQHRRWMGMEGGEYIINAFTFSHSSNQNCESCWVTLYNNRDIIPRARFIVSLVLPLYLHSFIPFTYAVASLSFSLHLPLFTLLSLFSSYSFSQFYCLCPPPYLFTRLSSSLSSGLVCLSDRATHEGSLSLSLGAYVHAEKTITSTYIHATR